ncbi:MAG: polysaccharide biosynthesis/export family protein [Breznakibacter sp.]
MSIKTHHSTPLWIAILAIATLWGGCIPRKQTMYLQDLSKQGNAQTQFDTLTEITGKYILKPNDYLYIRVYTVDPKISEFFNPTQGITQTMQEGTNRLYSYQIDDQLNIDFPFAGKINLANCNVFQARERIRQALEPFLKDAAIKVTMTNASFTALGEVRSPGLKTMPKDQITLFEAVGLMGELTAYGKRKEVLLLRQTGNGPVTYKIDLRDKYIVNSDIYYVYPNDVIYVKPMAAKSWGIGENFSLGILTTILTAYLLINNVL